MKTRLCVVTALTLVTALDGCSGPDAEFVYSEQTLRLIRPAQAGMRVEGEHVPGAKQVLDNHFGTPLDLIAWQRLPVDYGNDTGHFLKNGRGLYMQHCSHCHGTSGDGNGPTARYLNPKPRDYRKGVFKFTATRPLDKVTRLDLKRIIVRGIPGTYMPSFRLLTNEEVHSLVEYVRWLAMRGEFEQQLAVELEESFSQTAFSARVKGGEKSREILAELSDVLARDFADVADTAGTDLREVWEYAESVDALIVPGLARTSDSSESRRRGRALFLSAKAKCSNCHGEQALGNGPQTADYEDDPATGRKRSQPGLHDDWGDIIQPRNLTLGIYRGGRRPIDIFRRIYSGIKGAKMPAFGGSVLTDDEIWDLVNYVLSIPFGGAGTDSPEETQLARRN